MSWLEREWPYLLGASGLAGLLWIVAKTRPGAPLDKSAASGGPVVAPIGPPPFDLVKEMGSVPLVRGARYRACVRPGALSPVRFVSNDTLTQKMVEAGWSDVVVASSASWSGGLDCWRTVEATWSGADGQVVSRPGAVELAWVSRPV